MKAKFNLGDVLVTKLTIGVVVQIIEAESGISYSLSNMDPRYGIPVTVQEKEVIGRVEVIE